MIDDSADSGQPKEARPNLPWFKMLASEFLSRNLMLTTEQKGALACLMCYAWLTEDENPSDTDAAKITGLSLPRWKNMRAIVLTRLHETDLKEQKRRALEEYLRQSEAGKKGNRKRWGKEPESDSNVVTLPSRGDRNG